MPIDASGGHLSGRWSRGGAAPASLRFAYDRAARKRTDMAHDLDAADAEFQQSLPSFWGQKLTYGLSYRRYWDETRGPKWFRFEPPAVTQELLGVFVQDQITVVPERVTLTLGAKSERNDYTGWENQPGARIAWTPTDHQTFWGAVSRSVRIPSRLDRDSQLTGGSVPVDPTTVIVSRFIPSPDYESEKLVAYEGGWRARSGGTVFLGIDGFFNRYDDIQSFDIPTILLESDGPLTRFVLPIVFHNGIRGRTYGGEANIVWRPAPWWRLEGVYSYLRINLEYKGAPSFDSRGEIPNPNDGNVSVFNKESQVPRHQVVLRSSMDLPRGFALDPTARYVSGLPRGSDRLPIPAYWTADLRAAWTSTGGLELAVVGQNLLQARHDESAESSNEIERGVYGKATWRWGS